MGRSINLYILSIEKIINDLTIYKFFFQKNKIN